jgi:hypothetical protein
VIPTKYLDGYLGAFLDLNFVLKLLKILCQAYKAFFFQKDWIFFDTSLYEMKYIA